MRPFILGSFDYMGVESLDEFSVVLLARIRTVPGKQLVVGRAFNRLVKIAFSKNGITSRDPTPTAMVGPASPEQSRDKGDATPQRRLA